MLSGHGFVETATERVLIGPGDVVLSPPASCTRMAPPPDSPLAHLTVTTGGYAFPDTAASPEPDPPV